MKTPIVYTVTDSGPVDGVTVVEREIEFRLSFQDRLSIRKQMPREEYSHANDPVKIVEWWNERFVAEAFAQFYKALEKRKEETSR